MKLNQGQLHLNSSRINQIMSSVRLSSAMRVTAMCIFIVLCGPASCAPRKMGKMRELQGLDNSIHSKSGSSKSSGDPSVKDYSTYDFSEMLPPPIVTREPEVITVGCRSGFLGRGGDCRSSFSKFMFTVTDLAAARKPTPHRMIPNPSLYSLFPSFSSTRRRSSSTPTRPQTQREWLSSYSGFSKGRALLEKKNRRSSSSSGTLDSSNAKLYPLSTPTKPYDFKNNLADTDG